MNNTATMSGTKRQITEKQRLRKMSKAQMRLAVIKKKQCDAKALAIVEQLLEPYVNPDWLLLNLGYISKSHMEDVTEERAIVKLCGYVLCSNQLTVVIRQQYHISTRKNKVYDISRRKNFCSTPCYGAANFLLEQMLESPLWSREKEDIPVFQILPLNSKSTQCGDEIDVVGIEHSQNVDNNDDGEESVKRSATEQTEKVAVCNILSPEKEDVHTCHSLNYTAARKDGNEKETFIHTQKSPNCEMHPSELGANEESANPEEFTNPENNYDNNNVQQVDVNLENLEIKITGHSEKILHLHKHDRDAENKNIRDNDEVSRPQLDKISNNQNDISERLQLRSIEINDSRNDENEKRLQSQLDEINNSPNDGKITQLDKTCSGNNTKISSASTCDEYRKIKAANRVDKSKKYKSREPGNAEVQNSIYQKLTSHVEQNVREWITKNTLCLLIGQADEKNQLLEKLTQYDKYQQLCKKLNKLQLQDEKEDCVDLERNELKPLPHFSVLREEGKKMELKVRAFYEGRMTIPPPEDSAKESESKDDDEPILPLTDAHTPDALRRRIFLDNLDKILPDLMRALTINAQCTYNNESYSLIKILISTFNFSAANIVFKNAEWTLVGLIIVKMLSLIDTQMQLLLQSKQASMYTSMILTTYKLDSNYLDRLIMEITNKVDVDTSKSNDK